MEIWNRGSRHSLTLHLHFLNEPLANGKNPPTICRCKGALTQHLLAQRKYSNVQSTCKCQPVRYFFLLGSICCVLLDENSKLVKIQTIIYQNSTLFSDDYTILEKNGGGPFAYSLMPVASSLFPGKKKWPQRNLMKKISFVYFLFFCNLNVCICYLLLRG